MDKLILNCLPLASTLHASPAMSILKAFMHSKGYNVEVHYWNIAFEFLCMDFLKTYKGVDENDMLRLLHFSNYIALQQQDIEILKKIKYTILDFNTELVHEEDFSFDEHQQDFAVLLRQRIIEELEKLDIKNCLLFGISAKYFQLIPGNIIAGIVKEISPQTQIVIGGIGAKEECKAIMQNFPYYDFAVWGEGEYALLELFRFLKKEKDCLHPKNIPSLAYHDEQSLKFSEVHSKLFFDMNGSVFPNHSDFFSQKNNNLKQIIIPIEGSRGCHWHRCKFCFLNEGYRYRIKENRRIIQEIKHNIETFGVTKFLFLDNDLVSKNIEKYELLLDLLIVLRQAHPEFEIVGGEIITKGLNSGIIEKMALAGFSTVQIGYESSSDSILTKISKKNSFSSNLLFIKWANHFSIFVDGLNILRGLPDETDEDIQESIDNMHFLRFLFSKHGIFFNVNTGLAVGLKSPYFKELKEKNTLHEWTGNSYISLLPKSYFAYNDRFKLFYFTPNSFNSLWKVFEHTYDYYFTNTYKYSLMRHGDVICYQESFNNKKIKEIMFDKPIFWDILQLCNKQVLSIDTLTQKMHAKGVKKSRAKFITIVHELRREHLLYANKDCSEIVTVINTDRITY